MNDNPSSHSAETRCGMTLVELMVAVTLSAMLLGSLVGVLRGVANQTELAQRYDQPVWPARTLAILRRDLIAADSVWLEENVIWMRTDAPSYHSSNVGVREIGYGCTQIQGGTSMLVRTDGGQRSVLAIGPSRIEIERLDAGGIPQPLPPAPGPVPANVRVWVWEQVRSQPVLRRDLVLR